MCLGLCPVISLNFSNLSKLKIISTVTSPGWQSGSLSFHWITYANQSSIIPPKPIASHQRQRRYSNENRQGSSSSRNTSNSGSNTGAPKDNSPPMGRLEKWRALDPAWKRFILIILVIAMGTEFAAEAVLFYKIPYPIYQVRQTIFAILYRFTIASDNSIIIH